MTTGKGLRNNELIWNYTVRALGDAAVTAAG